MKTRAFVLALVASATSSCTNLSAVESLSSKLTDATRTWASVHADYEGSCRRMAQINPAVTDCDAQVEAGQSLAAATKVLAAYFKALNDVANKQNFTVQPGLDVLAASSAKIPGASKDQVEAVSGLAGLLARVALDGYRERTLRTLIEQGAPPALRVIDLLKGTVPETLGTTLALERDQLTGQFAIYIQQGGGTIGDPATLCDKGPRTSQFPGRGANFLLALEYCRRLAEVTAKQKALDQYGKSLDGAREAVEELNSDKTRLGAKELASRLYETGKEIDEAIGKLDSAFAGGGGA